MKIRLFARARAYAGTDVVELDLPDGTTVAEVRRELARVHPVLSALLVHSAVSVNDEFADDGMAVPAKAEIALLPPVSGG